MPQIQAASAITSPNNSFNAAAHTTFHACPNLHFFPQAITQIPGCSCVCRIYPLNLPTQTLCPTLMHQCPSFLLCHLPGSLMLPNFPVLRHSDVFQWKHQHRFKFGVQLHQLPHSDLSRDSVEIRACLWAPAPIPHSPTPIHYPVPLVEHPSPPIHRSACSDPPESRLREREREIPAEELSFLKCLNLPCPGKF